MNLKTSYLGLDLRNPLVPSASPLMDSIDNLRQLEEAGAGAVVLHSLFEEQITEEALSLHYHTTQGTNSFAESLSYFPEPEEYKLSSDEYLEHLRKASESLSIPVIASLNGVTAGGWLKYALHMQDAGADAIELNLYNVATDPEVPGENLVKAYLEVIRSITKIVSVPIAVKISPFFTSIPAVAKAMVEAGAEGLVLFNRFYQPDIDIEKREITSKIVLSSSADTRLPLRWIAILHGRIKASLAATTGVHTAEDVIKFVMAGADVTMLASALLKNGIGYLDTVRKDLSKWLQEHEYTSLAEMKGSLSQQSVPNPAAFERALYLKGLQSYRS